MAGLRVVHPQPIEQDERLLEGSAANGDVSLRAIWPSLLQVDRRVKAKDIDQAIRHQIEFADIDGVHWAVSLLEWDRLKHTRDYDGLNWGRLLTPPAAPRQQENQPRFA